MRKYFSKLYGQTSEFCFYSTDFLARFGVLRALILGNDHIIMDEHVHRALKDGAYATRTKGRIEVFKHNDMDHLEKLADEIRKQNPEDVIAVVTHDYYTATSTWSDLKKIHQICKKNTLMNVIDVCDSIFFTGNSGLSRL